MIALLLAVALSQDDPAQTGPYSVVVETRRYRDDQRNRSLRTELWLPGPTTSGEAPPQRAPLVLFSHGFAGTRLQSRFLCTHLASHGYVVAAPDHEGNTFLDLNLFKVTQSSIDRPHDLRVLLDKLVEEGHSPDSPLFGRIDAQRSAAVGHSFGGYTALATVGAWLDLREKKARGNAKPSDPDYMDFDDPRIVAAVALTPVMTPYLTPDSVRMVRKPVLIIGASRDAQTSPRLHQEPLFQALHGVRYLGIVEGATHFNFCDQDFIDAAPLVIRTLHRPTIDRKAADALILRQTTAFLEHYLRGSPRYDRWLSAKQDHLGWRFAFPKPGDS